MLTSFRIFYKLVQFEKDDKNTYIEVLFMAMMNNGEDNA